MLKLCIDLASLRHLVPEHQDFSRVPHSITTVLKPTRSGQVIPFRAPLAVDFHHFAYDRISPYHYGVRFRVAQYFNLISDLAR